MIRSSHIACLSRALLAMAMPLVILVVALPPVFLASGPAKAGTLYTAEFDGAQCVPPTDSPATGHADLYLSSDQSNLRIQIRIWNLQGTMTACHVHQGAPGQYGSQLFNIPVFQDSTAADWTITDYGRRNLKLGDLFINIHTVENPNGEIRGQIYPDSSLSLTASLAGTQVVPPNGSPGAGVADLTLWPDGHRVHVELSVSGLSGLATASDISRAHPGFNGPLVWTLGAPVNRVVVDLAPTNQQVVDLLNGICYAEVETASYPAGEVRGQIGGSTTAGAPGGPGLPGGGPRPRAEPRLDLAAGPNPTRTTAGLRFRLPDPRQVRLEIFDASGHGIRRIDSGLVPAGTASLSWDLRTQSGRRALPGTYLARVSARGAAGVLAESVKIIVLR